MALASVPITLHVGTVVAELGSIELPITSGPARQNGLRFLDVSVDMPEMRRRIAELLRGAAELIEEADDADHD